VKAPALLLASSSPRRQQLLAARGFEFETAASNVAERSDPHLTARELTTWNAARKGLIVARQYPEKVVLAADTVVVLHDEVIGKPADLAHANRILRLLSGRIHQVFSAVFVAHLTAAKMKVFSEVSHVRFRKLTETQIRSYLARIDPLDKAGAYAAQGFGSEIIAEIDGSYSNVVGLPMERTTVILAEFGIKPRRP
jgi:septum formation protein